MFNRTKAQYKISHLEKYLCLQLVIGWRQLCNFVDGESLNRIWGREKPIAKSHDDGKTSDCQNTEANFPASILLSTFTDKFDYDAIVFESLTRLWMIFIVLNLFPSDASDRNEVTLEFFIRHTTMFFQKVVDRLGKILIGFSDCWIESKQLHRKSLSFPSELSLYQFIRHFSDRKVNQSVRSCTTVITTKLRRVITCCLGRNWSQKYECS